MRRPFGTASLGCGFGSGRMRPEDSTEESGADHPDTESEEFAGSFYVFEAWKGTVQGFCALCVWGCSLKSVE